jgi:predicted NAD/FAD-dependent oxidoreductase
MGVFVSIPRHNIGMTQPSCLIIGAGIAGLMAAHHLQNAGFAVTVLDKGRGVGGRMATRRLSAECQADHGAQYFTVKTDKLRPYLDKWLAAGVVRQWSDGFYDTAGTPHFNGEPRYVGTSGMTSLPKYLAKTIDVRTQTRVKQINYDNRFEVIAEDGQTFSAQMLLLTPPAEQSLTLLDSGNLTIPIDARNALQAIQFNPCIALMLTLDAPSNIPAPGGLWPKNSIIAWIADNRQKGISEGVSLTLHGSAEFSQTYDHSDPATITQLLIAAAKPLIGNANILTHQLHHWRYSQPTVLHPEPTLLIPVPAPIALAGDAFAGARVEGAALSGIAAAERLLQALSS